jgi:hypothetical protein
MKRGELMKTLAAVAIAALTSFTTTSHARPNDSETRLRASLFGDAAAGGHVEYREKQRDDGLERRFKVRVEDAAPGAEYDVFVGDYFAGSFIINSLGKGKLDLRTDASGEPGEDNEPMPPNFPLLDSGQPVLVGAMSGVLFTQGGSGGGAEKFRLRGRERSGEFDIDVRYEERFKNGTLMRKFKVEIEDANEGDVYDIVINGQTWGSVTIGSDDEGRFELRTAAFIDDPDDGEPMPDSFPSLVVGDIVTVGGFNVDLELKD